jgi:hypothetical protein
VLFPKVLLNGSTGRKTTPQIENLRNDLRITWIGERSSLCGLLKAPDAALSLKIKTQRNSPWVLIRLAHLLGASLHSL